MDPSQPAPLLHVFSITYIDPPDFKAIPAESYGYQVYPITKVEYNAASRTATVDIVSMDGKEISTLLLFEKLVYFKYYKASLLDRDQQTVTLHETSPITPGTVIELDPRLQWRAALEHYTPNHKARFCQLCVFLEHGYPADCDLEECEGCSVLVCPEGDPWHFHHDGCPTCDKPK